VVSELWHHGLDKVQSRLPFRPTDDRIIDYDQLDRVHSLLYLMPLDTACRGERAWGESKDGELLLRTPIGVFVASRGTEFTEETLERITDRLPVDWTEEL
jgi:hypothetical protein